MKSTLIQLTLAFSLWHACADLSAADKKSTATTSQPNFIFFITDDISPDDLSVYGNRVIKTPNLDAISRKGLVFDAAFNVTSSCSPSRCAIITGRYPHNTGAPELHTTLPATQRTFIQELKKAGYYTVLSGKNHMTRSAEQLGFEVNSDSHPGGEENWIRHLRERPKDKPFFCWFASHDAHHPLEINDKAPIYKPEDIEVPPMMFDGPLTRGDLAKYYHEVSRTDYYAGELMRELEAQGVADNTYFIYCSDNGRPFPRCKTYLYDSGTQTPLIITGPGIAPGRSNSLISSIDYAPTILRLAGLAVPETVQGVSFEAVLRNPTASTRDVLFAERNWHVYALHERMVRTNDWLYIWNAWPDQPNLCQESAAKSLPAARELWQKAAQGQLNPAQMLLTLPQQPPEMLFNVKADPNQFTNLALDQRYAAVLQQARKLMDTWKAETGDNVPKNPTKTRGTQPADGNGKKLQRGDFAGAAHNATAINQPGPIRTEFTTDQPKGLAP